MDTGDFTFPLPAGYMLLPGVLHAYRASASDLAGYEPPRRPRAATTTTATTIALAEAAHTRFEAPFVGLEPASCPRHGQRCSGAKLRPRLTRRCDSMIQRAKKLLAVVSGSVAFAGQGACTRQPPAPVTPTVELTRVPEAAEGGPTARPRSGPRRGARPGQQIVLYARSGPWWVQPLADQPFTAIRPDSSFESTTHLGTEYAALLVEPGYSPPLRSDQLPAVEGGVVAVVTAKGVPPRRPAPPRRCISPATSGACATLRASAEAGTTATIAENAWTDDDGGAASADRPERRVLDLRGGHPDAQPRLRELQLRGAGRVAPPARRRPGPLHVGRRGRGAALSRAGRRDQPLGYPANANAQYVVQPYYVPANVSRFQAPAGTLTHTLRWKLGSASFRDRERRARVRPPRVVAEHTFSTGVPQPGNETVRMNLYVFGSPTSTLPLPIEVVVQSFEFLP